MNEKQIWKRLLSSNRINDLKKNKQTSEQLQTDIRNPFERDADRIIYSYPFRRLQDKTQVIPLPIIDFVHTRLTHTLEVATVGRSLGKLLEEFLLEKDCIEETQLNHIPTIIYSACLAHDIGNPPFGHSGEDSISDYFITGKGKKYISKYFSDDLKNSKIKDLQNYEGNALGFYLLNNYEGVGLNLTCATLATFTKYPRISYIKGDNKNNKLDRWNNKRISQKKYGFFIQDLENFKIVANETGMIKLKKGISWCRHPLSFLLEAADDICYRIIDLEDGFRVGKIPFKDCEKALKKIAIKDHNWKEGKYNTVIDTDKKKFAYLRSLVINTLTYKAIEVFKKNYKNILLGKFDEEILKKIDDEAIITAINSIKDLVRKYVYKSSDVLTLEATGYEVLGGLTSEFIESSNYHDSKNLNLSRKHGKYFDLLPDEYRDSNSDYYIRYLKICNYVAGMSDSYALNLYQKLNGIKI
ncbi:dGTP triphosphohydrolase [Chryseobacterium nepalense]|uniref:dGTP triphosphohydrolase n=1 Tax=Chryseobacterium nepalense TaxID=1854498 RepID=UPI002DF8B4DE|nr:dGTPase [Chryseobacterium nepalense]